MRSYFTSITSTLATVQAVPVADLEVSDAITKAAHESAHLLQNKPWQKLAGVLAGPANAYPMAQQDPAQALDAGQLPGLAKGERSMS